MFKLPFVAVAFAALLTSGCVAAGNGNRLALNIPNPSSFGARVPENNIRYAGAQQQEGHQNCPEGTRPAGKLGCMGEPITNREDLQQFDRPIEHGCVEGRTREMWTSGPGPQGGTVSWLIKQHEECHRNHSES